MTIQQAIAILALQMPTSSEAIKKAYREQAKLWHPDNFRLYDQQIEAGHRFIQAKEAYDFLRTVDIASLNNYKPAVDDGILRRNRHAEAPGYTNDIPLFNTPIFKEAQNIFSLFYLLSKWDWLGVPAFFSQSYHKVNRYIQPHKEGLVPAMARLFLFVLIAVSAIVLAGVSLPLFAFAGMVFVPLMWLYVKIVKWATLLLQKVLGYLPSPNCGRVQGELIYLFIRTWVPVALIIWGVVYLPTLHISFAGWLFLGGYLLFIALIGASVLYEWVSFASVLYLRRKFKTV